MISVFERAAARGLVRDTHGWSRGSRIARLVGRADDGSWWWAPESRTWADVAASPRYRTEAEALAMALDWLDAGEPALVLA